MFGLPRVRHSIFVQQIRLGRRNEETINENINEENINEISISLIWAIARPITVNYGAQICLFGFQTITIVFTIK